MESSFSDTFYLLICCRFSYFYSLCTLHYTPYVIWIGNHYLIEIMVYLQFSIFHIELSVYI